MEGLVLALVVLKNQYQRPARTIPEPEFQPFNLAALKLPKDTDDTTRGAEPKRRTALAATKYSVMPVKVYLDEDADLLDLQNKACAVIGFGSQGHAHALNLKDSGIEVIVGLYQGSKSIPMAQSVQELWMSP